MHSAGRTWYLLKVVDRGSSLHNAVMRTKGSASSFLYGARYRGGYRDTGVPERELRRYEVSTSYYRRLVLKLRQKTLDIVFKAQ